MAPIFPTGTALMTSVQSIAPEIVVVATALVILVLDLVVDGERKRILCWTGILGVAVSLASVAALGSATIVGFSGMVVHDGLGAFADVVILCACGLTFLMATGYSEWEGTHKGEFYSLILLATSGMMFLAKGADLMTVFLGLETLSIPLYVLVGFHRHRISSVEAALKYFLLGAFATGFFLYGIALMYAATGTTKIASLATALYDAGIAGSPLFLIGAGLLLVGLAFKVSLVPFHMWTPDAYEGAPTVITVFMSAAVKAAAFAALIRVLLVALPGAQPALWKILWILAVLTMTVGNLSALAQDNLKRLLAYSSIAHAGYVLVGLVAGGVLGGEAALFYLLVYVFMNAGAFGVAILLAHKEDDGYDIRNLRGVGFRYPALGALLTLFLVSLGGIPPTAGFVGKFYLFSAAVKNGYIGLAVIGVLNSAVSLYYYLRVAVYLYMVPREDEVPVPRPPRILFSAALCACAAVVLVLGLVPASVLAFAERSVLSLLM